MTGPPWYRRLPVVTASGRMAVRAGYRPRIGCWRGAESPTEGTAEAADPVAASTPQQNSNNNTACIGWRLRDTSMLAPLGGGSVRVVRVSARTEEPTRLFPGLP